MCALAVRFGQSWHLVALTSTLGVGCSGSVGVVTYKQLVLLALKCVIVTNTIWLYLIVERFKNVFVVLLVVPSRVLPLPEHNKLLALKLSLIHI